MQSLPEQLAGPAAGQAAANTLRQAAWLSPREKGLVYRVPKCLSLLLNWLPLPPSLASVCPPALILGGTPSLAGEGVGGPNSDDRPETLALCILCALSLSPCHGSL